MKEDQQLKEILTDLLGKAETHRVLEILIETSKFIEIDNENYSTLIVQSSRFEELENNNRLGTISTDNYNITRNQITKALVDTLNTFHKQGILSNAISSGYRFKLLSLFPDAQRLVILENEFSSLLDQLFSISKLFTSREPKYEWISSFNSQLNEFKLKWDERRFQVAILALVKAGKSTLLNAWIGEEYLPSATLPETMQVIKIRHNQNLNEGVLYVNGEEKERGVEDIRKYLRKLNENSRTSSKESEVLLETNLAVLNDKNLSGYGFDILDTPGTNEAGIETLHAKIEIISKSSDVIIYLIDFTKLSTSDEAQMFENLKKWRKELFIQLKSRLFFVVNKIDINNRHDREKKMSPEEIKKYVSSVLFGYANIRVDEKDIILVSAELALLSRLVGNNIATNEQLHDFKIKAFGEIGVEDATKEDCLRAVPKLVGRSGFKELEDKVLKLIYSNRSFIFFRSIIDDIEKSLNQVVNNLEISKGTLISTQDAIDTLQKKIKSIRDGAGGFREENNEFKKKANDVIQKRLKEFDNSVSRIVSDAFSRTAGASKILLSKNIFSNSDYEILDTNKEDLMRKLDLINKFVIESIENQFESTWNNVVEDIYVQYISLKENLQNKSKPVIKQVEKAIDETFEIKLNPSNFEIKNPSFVNYYKEMQYDLTSLIKLRFNFSGVFFPDLLQGIFLLIAMIMDNKYPKFKISSIEYRKRISQTTNGVIAESTVLANDLLRSKYLNTVVEAENSLKQFIDRYIAIIEKEIANRQEKNTNIPMRIANIDADIKQAKILIDQIERLNKSIESIK